ncbi:MAG: CcmD family protein [Gammaproteobacteria bacterium]|nr:CcmD family protein [Gammaproteobacteria bacterium]
MLAQQSLRPYWYVFIAYALAWLLLLGWMFSIGRRMRGLEDGGTGNRDA